MDLRNSKRLDETIEAKAVNRPVKIAYLVPYEESETNNLILDAVFYDSYKRWSGAYSLLIPTESNQFLNPIFASWLEYYDPDIIYSYVDLDISFIFSIEKLCTPIALLKHEIGRHIKKDDITWRSYLPDYSRYVEPISSITTVRSPNTQALFSLINKEHGNLTIITQYSDDPGDRFITDNFGRAFHRHTVTHEIPSLFETLSYVPNDLPENHIAGTRRCKTYAELLSEINNRKATPIARFAMLHSEAVPRPESYAWSNSFNLFIGESVKDRINFWNVRNFSTNQFTAPSSFVIKYNFFENDEFVKEIGNYFNNFNFLGRNSGQHEVSICSHSHSEEELLSVREKLTKQTYNVLSTKKLNDFVLPEQQNLERGYSKSFDSYNIKLTEYENELVANRPAHLTYIEPRFKSISDGQWIVDLAVQRHNNLSKYSNVFDYWILPKRNKITRAFTKNIGRVTKEHNLALVPATEHHPLFRDNQINIEYYFNLNLPEDEEFFRCLVLDSIPYPEDDLRSKLKLKAYKDISSSDKGQNLRGVISIFSNLNSAYEILTNKYWRDVLRAGKADSTKYLVYDLNKLTSLLPNDNVTKEKFRDQLRFDDVRDVTKHLNNNLLDTLEHLIRINIFYLVYQWRCSYCGHMNTRNYDGMKIKNNCEICDKEYYPPIDHEWKYQLSEFVYRSLVKHNGLSVLWTLGFLQDRNLINGFWYVPEIDLYEEYDNDQNKNEIDILCIVGGRYYAVEVKKTASLFINKEDEKDKFIKKINLLNPDCAMLSFEEYCSPQGDVSEIKGSLSNLLNEIKNELNPGIELESIVASELPDFKDFQCYLGTFGYRTR